MRSIFTILMCATLVASALVLRADDPPEKSPSREDSEKRKEEWKKLSPEEREAKMNEWRKTNAGPSRAEMEKRREQLKNMTPEERAAKRKEIKERLEKRIAELKAKQTNGELATQEARELERREQILKRFEQEDSGTPRIERPKVVLTNSPAEN
jgi:hypothetical protein